MLPILILIDTAYITEVVRHIADYVLNRVRQRHRGSVRGVNNIWVYCKNSTILQTYIYGSGTPTVTIYDLQNVLFYYSLFEI